MVAGSGTGGAGPGRLVLPETVDWLTDSDERAAYYLYRVVVGVTASELGFAAEESWSKRRRVLAMLIAVPTVHAQVAVRYPGFAPLLDRVAVFALERFPFDEQTPDARAFSSACRARPRPDLGTERR